MTTSFLYLTFQSIKVHICIQLYLGFTIKFFFTIHVQKSMGIHDTKCIISCSKMGTCTTGFRTHELRMESLHQQLFILMSLERSVLFDSSSGGTAPVIS